MFKNPDFRGAANKYLVGSSFTAYTALFGLADILNLQWIASFFSIRDVYLKPDVKLFFWVLPAVIYLTYKGIKISWGNCRKRVKTKEISLQSARKQYIRSLMEHFFVFMCIYTFAPVVMSVVMYFRIFFYGYTPFHP